MDYAEAPWAYVYDIGMPAAVARAKPGFVIHMPTAPGSSVNYLWTRRESRLYSTREARRSGRDHLIVAGEIHASPDAAVIGVDDDIGGNPPQMRPMLCRSMYGGNSRWWTIRGIDLIPGRFLHVVPMRPALWGQVWGRPGSHSRATRQGYRKTLTRPIRPALTMGEGSDYGHGLRMGAGRMSIHVTTYRFRK